MPLSTHTDNVIYKYRWGGGGFTDYIAPICGIQWKASTAVTAGTYMVATSYTTSTADAVRTIFVCTSPGTTGASEPAFNVTPGGTTTDGTVTWTECTLRFKAGALTGSEPTDPTYHRQQALSTRTMWPEPSNGAGTNGLELTFGTSTVAWGTIIGFSDWSDGDAGTAEGWGLLRYAIVVGGPHLPVRFPPGSLAMSVN